MKKQPLFAVLSTILFLLLAAALSMLPSIPGSLTGPSIEALPLSGVSSPITAVLLNYRGYDTLLEIGVLLLAVIGVWSLREGNLRPVEGSPRPLLLPFLRLVLPVLVLVSGYFLWIGSTRPGGAFQGGAMIGGALVLAISGSLMSRVLDHQTALRAGLAIGLTVFIAVAAATLAVNGQVLRYPTNSAGLWILLIESAALISIGLTLGALFAGGRPPLRASEDPNRESVYE